MNNHNNIYIHGFPENLSENEFAVWNSRFSTVASKFLSETKHKELNVTVSNIEKKDGQSTEKQKVNNNHKKNQNEITKEERAKQYISQEPFYSFNSLVLPEETRRHLLLAVNLIRLESRIFNDWNLRVIEPFPRTALNFHGNPGTGKTLAAHAIASYLGKPILVASYAQIESKFHGDGPKNVEAIFHAAERDGAVLFIDEADSLLSKRLTNVTQGSEQAINSMRSQLLICLEQFKGIVVFATNLVTNYDRAFETRVRNIHFPLPDEKSRSDIWKSHLMFENGPPLSDDISIPELAKIEDICGRDIKNAVIDAALKTAQENRLAIEMKDISDAINLIISSRAKDITPSTPQHGDEKMAERIQKAVNER